MLLKPQNAFAFGVLILAFAAPAMAHEGVKMECSDTVLNAIKADVQSMPESDDTQTAAREVALAEEMRAKSDLKACSAHLHNAAEALEK